MVKKSSVEKWELPQINVDVNDDGDVISISCKSCKKYYVDDDEGREELKKFTRKVKELVVKWISRSHTIKKINAQQHIQKAKDHADATRRLKERADSKKLELTEAEQIAQTSTVSGHQRSILTQVRLLQHTQREQYIRKFQTAHFRVINNCSVNMYKKFAEFEKNVDKVDMGTGFLNDKSGQELILFLFKFLFCENVVDPLNDGTRLYFSLLYDGSSSAKTSDERELYIIKTWNNIQSQFDVLSLQKPDDTGS